MADAKWHIAAAEKLLDAVNNEDMRTSGQQVQAGYHESMARLVARAQVHATLALALKEDPFVIPETP